MHCQSESEYKVSYSVIITVTELTVISTDLPLDLSILGNLGLQSKQRENKFLDMLTFLVFTYWNFHKQGHNYFNEAKMQVSSEPGPSINHFTFLDCEILAITHCWWNPWDCRQWIFAVKPLSNRHIGTFSVVFPREVILFFGGHPIYLHLSTTNFDPTIPQMQ